MREGIPMHWYEKEINVSSAYEHRNVFPFFAEAKKKDYNTFFFVCFGHKLNSA